MAEGQDEGLVAALQRLVAGEEQGDDLPRLQQAVAKGRITLAPGERSLVAMGNVTESTALASGSQAVIQSGGVHFGQSNQIQISGSVIGTMTLSLPSAAEAVRLLDALAPFRPDQLPPPDILPEPGGLPPGSCLPFPRNAVFTGREEDLKALAMSLLYEAQAGAGGSHTAVGITQAAAAAGTGGVGKTQLAVEFCYRYGRFTHGTHWLHADQDMTAEIAACGMAMGLLPWPEALPDQAQATLREWAHGGSRLVVLDDVENVAVVQEWLPKLLEARVLVTSRQRDWPPDLGLALVAVDSLPRAESLRLLRKLAPRLEKVPDDELDRAAEQLGDLPLALDLAGRYLGDRRGLRPADFLHELEEAGSVLAHSALRDWTRYNPTQHGTNLAATFTLSWNRLGCLEEATPCTAQRLLCAAGYCAANTPIPWDVFYDLEEAADGQAQAAVDKALGALEDGGLLSLGEAGALIHPLLAEFARLHDGAGEESILPGLAEALGLLAERAAQNELPELFKPLRAHVETAARWAEQRGLTQSGNLWYSLGHHLDVVAEYSGAKTALEKALHIDEAALGGDHPNVARDARILGDVLRELGDYAEAQAAHERALRIDEAFFGPEAPLVARDVSDLGLALHELGDYPKAKAAFERALSVAETALGLEHTDVAMILNNQGRVLQVLGDLDGARASLERALRIGEAADGSDHPNLAFYLNNLGEVLRDLGDFPGARAAYERALRIIDKHFGPENRHGAVYRNNLGTLLFALGDYAGAKSAFEQTARILEAILGPEHPEVATRINNLGVVLRQQGDYAGARAAFEQALRIDEAVYGPDHPDVATDVNNLGAMMRILGDYTGAQAVSERALAIDEAAFGPDHPYVARDIINLGAVLQALGDTSGAKAAFERALAIDEAAFGGEHPDVARDVNNLGEVLNAMGAHDEAKAAIERALAIDEEVLGPEHPNVARDVNNLGLVLQALGDSAAAEAAFEKALRIDEAAFGPDHPNVARDVNNLGELLQARGETAGAKAAFERALRIYEKTLPADHPNIHLVRGNLESL